jgi:hypothetical protein
MRCFNFIAKKKSNFPKSRKNKFIYKPIDNNIEAFLTRMWIRLKPYKHLTPGQHACCSHKRKEPPARLATNQKHQRQPGDHFRMLAYRTYLDIFVLILLTRSAAG